MGLVEVRGQVHSQCLCMMKVSVCSKGYVSFEKPGARHTHFKTSFSLQWIPKGWECAVGAVSSNTLLFCCWQESALCCVALVYIYIYLYYRICFDSTLSQGRSLRQDHRTRLSGNNSGPATTVILSSDAQPRARAHTHTHTGAAINRAVAVCVSICDLCLFHCKAIITANKKKKKAGLVNRHAPVCVHSLFRDSFHHSSAARWVCAFNDPPGNPYLMGQLRASVSRCYNISISLKIEANVLQQSS